MTTETVAPPTEREPERRVGVVVDAGRGELAALTPNVEPTPGSPYQDKGWHPNVGVTSATPWRA